VLGRPESLEEEVRPESKSPSDGQLAKTQSFAFRVGERLVYEVRWLGIPVGTIVSEIESKDKIDGRDAYKITLLVRTNDFCSKIYRIEDRYVSYMDAEKLFSLKHIADRKEGRYRKNARTTFDHEAGKAYFHNQTDGSRKVFEIPRGVQDPLTSVYYFRTASLKENSRVYYKVVNNEKVYDLYGLVKKRAFVKSKYGDLKECFYVVPYAILNEEKYERGDASFYITSDESRIPVLISIRAPMFTKITVSLKENK
jgi:hypothetical protein